MSTKKAPAIVVAVESFSAAVPGMEVPEFTVLRGARLPDSHPAVKANPQFFIEDGADTSQEQAARLALNAGEPQVAADPIRVTISKRLKDSEAAVAIQRLVFEDQVVTPGDRVGKRDRIYTKNRDAFVPVLADGLERRDCLRCEQTMAHTNAKGETHIAYKGQLVPSDSEFVSLHPLLFSAPYPEPDEEEKA